MVGTAWKARPLWQQRANNSGACKATLAAEKNAVGWHLAEPVKVVPSLGQDGLDGIAELAAPSGLIWSSGAGRHGPTPAAPKTAVEKGLPPARPWVALGWSPRVVALLWLLAWLPWLWVCPAAAGLCWCCLAPKLAVLSRALVLLVKVVCLGVLLNCACDWWLWWALG